MASLTFGSVGDIITICGLVINAAGALSDSIGSAAEYQELLREVRSLNAALQSISAAVEGDPHVQRSEHLRDALTNCNTCLNSYLGRIKKYHEALKAGGSKNVVKTSYESCNGEGLERILLVFEQRHDIQANRRHRDALERFIESKFRSMVEGDKNKNLVLQMDATLQQHQTQTDARFSQIIDAIAELSKTKTLDAASTKNLEKTQLLLEQLATMMAQEHIPQRLDRTWTQDPAILDDALGRIFPIHLEFINSWESFLFVLAGHFKGTSGAAKVERKEFLLHGSAGRKIQFHSIWDIAFRPGERITMSMLFARRRVARSSCPLCHADNEDATDCEVQCRECNTSYRRITELEGPAQSSVLDEATLLVEGGNVSDSDLDIEATEELHGFRRLAPKAGTDNKADAVSERAIGHLISYGLARSREEAVAMLLAKAGSNPPKPLPMLTQNHSKAQMKEDASKALIRVNEVDHFARRNLQDIVSLTDCVSKLSVRSGDGILGHEALASQFAQSHQGDNRKLPESASLQYVPISEKCSSDASKSGTLSGDSQANTNADRSLENTQMPTGLATLLVQDFADAEWDGPEKEGDRSLGWHYFDEGIVKGPFAGLQMHQANKAGQFPDSMLLKSTVTEWEMLIQLKNTFLNENFPKEDPFRNTVLPTGKRSDPLPEIPEKMAARAFISNELWQRCRDFTAEPPADTLGRASEYKALRQKVDSALWLLSSPYLHKTVKEEEQMATAKKTGRSLLLLLNSVFKVSGDINLAEQTRAEKLALWQHFHRRVSRKLQSPLTIDAQGLERLKFMTSELSKAHQAVKKNPLWCDFKVSQDDNMLRELTDAEEDMRQWILEAVKLYKDPIPKDFQNWLVENGFSKLLEGLNERPLPRHSADEVHRWGQWAEQNKGAIKIIANSEAKRPWRVKKEASLLGET